MNEEVRTDRESQLTALQIVVKAIALTLRDNPEFQRNLGNLRGMGNVQSLSPEEKAKVELSIKRIT